MPIERLLLVPVPKWNLKSGEITSEGSEGLINLLNSFSWEFKNKDWEIFSGTLPRFKETARIVKSCFVKESEIMENLLLNVFTHQDGINLTKLLDTNLIPIPIDCNHAVMVLPNQDVMIGFVSEVIRKKGKNGYLSKNQHPAILIFLSSGEIEEIRQAEPQQLEFKV